MNNSFDKSTVKLLLDIIFCFFNNKTYDKIINKSDFEKLRFLSEIHSLSPIIFSVIQNNLESSVQEIGDKAVKMKKEYRYAIFHSSQQENCIDEISRAFYNENIQAVFFKGSEIKNYYPVPALRTMGDIDCLIKESDRQTAYKIMCDLGYTNSAQNLDVWEYDKNNIHIEMQSRLAHNGVGNGFNYTEYFSDAFEHTVFDEEGHLRFENEYNLCYLIYHITKHLSSTGAGIRMVLDIAVFTRRFEKVLDLNRLKKMLDETKLCLAANAIYSLCDKWFATNFLNLFGYEEYIPDGLEEYIIYGGVFGFETHDTGDVYRRRTYENSSVDKSNSRFVALKNFFFPSADYMQQYIPSVKKHRWLLPLAWIKRWIIGLFKRKEHSLSTLDSISSGDNDKSQKEAQMLRKLGL